MVTAMHGIQFISDPHLSVPEHYMENVDVRRSWGKRLFSWPWRPWVNTETVEVLRTRRVPDPRLYSLDGGRTMFGHPATIQRARDAMLGERP